MNQLKSNLAKLAGQAGPAGDEDQLAGPALGERRQRLDDRPAALDRLRRVLEEDALAVALREHDDTGGLAVARRAPAPAAATSGRRSADSSRERLAFRPSRSGGEEQIAVRRRRGWATSPVDAPGAPGRRQHGAAGRSGKAHPGRIGRRCGSPDRRARRQSGRPGPTRLSPRQAPLARAPPRPPLLGLRLVGRTGNSTSASGRVNDGFSGAKGDCSYKESVASRSMRVTSCLI